MIKPLQHLLERDQYVRVPYTQTTPSLSGGVEPPRTPPESRRRRVTTQRTTSVEHPHKPVSPDRRPTPSPTGTIRVKRGSPTETNTTDTEVV